MNSGYFDRLTSRHTAFGTFRDFVSAGYTPTLLPHGDHAWEIRTLADAFDGYHERAGSPVRVWRGSNAPDTELDFDGLDELVADLQAIDYSQQPEPIPEPDPAVYQRPAEGLSQQRIRANADDMENPGNWHFRIMPVKNKYHTDRRGFPALGILEYERTLRGDYTVFLCNINTPPDELEKQPKIHFISAEAAASAGWEID